MAALLALVSSVLWGSADFAGGLAARRLPVMVVVGYSQTAALIGILVIAVASGAVHGPGGWAGWAVTAGLAGALGLVCFYSALAVGTMGVVSPIAALGVVVPVLAGLLAGEQPTLVQGLGMALAIGGALAASGPELSGRTGVRSVVLAVAAGLCFGLALLGIARGAQHNAVMTLAGMRVASVTGFAVVALVTRRHARVAVRELPWLAAIGLVDAGANLLFGLAARLGMVSIVAVLGALYPVATVLLARYVLDERMLGIQRVGVATAMAGVVLLAAG